MTRYPPKFVHGTTVAVVVPAYNAAAFLPRCLAAIAASSHAPTEVIVVDDASTDGSTDAALDGVNVLRMAVQSGPAAARNHGAAHAKSEVVFFVDADVELAPDAIALALAVLDGDPSIAAVFGSYDDAPAEGNFFSQYKNLYHHFVHQSSSSEASTVWSGCGAVRREVFLAIGGFDADRYRFPSIEDIELGGRLRASGHRIRLEARVLAKHLKHWTLRSWLAADIFARAVPWSRLILERKETATALNLRAAERVRAVLAGFLAISISIAPWSRWGLALFGFALAANLAANFKLLRFFARLRGVSFAAAGFVAHISYYLYGAATFALCFLERRIARRSVRHPEYDGAVVRKSHGYVDDAP